MEALLDRIEAAIESGAVAEAAAGLARAEELLTIGGESPRASARAAWLSSVVGLLVGQRDEFEGRSLDAIAALRSAGAEEEARTAGVVRAVFLGRLRGETEDLGTTVATHLEPTVQHLVRTWMAPDMTTPLLLVGAPGSGKRATGRAVATALGRPFLDMSLQGDDDVLSGDTGQLADALITDTRARRSIVYLDFAGAYEACAEVALALAERGEQTLLGVGTRAASAELQRLLPPCALVAIPSLPIEFQPAVWTETLTLLGCPPPPTEELKRQACRPGLVASEIEAAAAVALMRLSDEEDAHLAASDLAEALDEQLSVLLDELASRLDDEPFPVSDPTEELRIVETATRAAHVALEAWEARGAGSRGFVAHVHGGSYAQRALAAVTLAQRLDVPIRHVDFAWLASLSRNQARRRIEELFRAVERCDAALFMEPLEALLEANDPARRISSALRTHLAMSNLTVVLGSRGNPANTGVLVARADCEVAIEPGP